MEPVVRALEHAIERLPSGVRAVIDVDPVNLL
jgi:hypothetical protein